MAGTSGELHGHNLYAYCFNNPITMTDSEGEWPTREDIKNGWNKFTNWLGDTFSVGIVQSDNYKAMSLGTLFFGAETGVSTRSVIYGDVSKPISLYIETSSRPWRFWENKVGVQINTSSGGFSFATNFCYESSLTIASKNSSIEFIGGINKFGTTVRKDVDFANQTAGTYYHEYIRTLPTAFAVVTVWLSKGVALPLLNPQTN